jgi:glycosidase
MPKLNTNNPEVRKYILDIVSDWIKIYDIDGLRLDVANELSHRFCKELRSTTKRLKTDFFILGEIWHDGMEWLRGDEFDSVMNYPLGNTISGFWLQQDKNSFDFEEEVNKNLVKYMVQTNEVMFNLLDSHDTNRLMNKVKSIDVFYQQLALLFTMYGSPCIYYGTEIAMEGEHDPDCRRCMPWDEIEKKKYDGIIDKVKQLIDLRHRYDAARNQEFRFIHDKNNSRVIHYKKTDFFEVIINAMEIDYPIQENLSNIVFKHKYEQGRLKSGGILIINKN